MPEAVLAPPPRSGNEGPVLLPAGWNLVQAKRSSQAKHFPRVQRGLFYTYILFIPL